MKDVIMPVVGETNGGTSHPFELTTDEPSSVEPARFGEQSTHLVVAAAGRVVAAAVAHEAQAHPHDGPLGVVRSRSDMTSMQMRRVFSRLLAMLAPSAGVTVTASPTRSAKARSMLAQRSD